jgi:hypothetical protein
MFSTSVSVLMGFIASGGFCTWADFLREEDEEEEENNDDDDDEEEDDEEDEDEEEDDMRSAAISADIRSR